MSGEQLYNLWRDEFGNGYTDFWLQLTPAQRDHWEHLADKVEDAVYV